MAERTTGRCYFNTSFRNGGRKAGYGITHDDYSETSGCKNYEKRGLVRLPHDNADPHELNGEVIIVQKGRKKNEHL